MSPEESKNGDQQSPFWPQNLINLFFRPRKFFSKQLALGKAPYVFFVTWCYGIANFFITIDRKLIQVELGKPRPFFDEFFESWVMFWLIAFMMGAFSGIFLWFLGGWLYGVRLEWSGDHEPDKEKARLVYVYSSFVHSGPHLAYVLICTFVYANYSQAYLSKGLFPYLLLVFTLWSLVTSYIGTRTLFQVKRLEALLWFVYFPSPSVPM